jgi:hypothetical protein
MHQLQQEIAVLCTCSIAKAKAKATPYSWRLLLLTTSHVWNMERTTGITPHAITHSHRSLSLSFSLSLSLSLSIGLSLALFLSHRSACGVIAHETGINFLFFLYFCISLTRDWQFASGKPVNISYLKTSISTLRLLAVFVGIGSKYPTPLFFVLFSLSFSLSSLFLSLYLPPSFTFFCL